MIKEKNMIIKVDKDLKGEYINGDQCYEKGKLYYDNGNLRSEGEYLYGKRNG